MRVILLLAISACDVGAVSSSTDASSYDTTTLAQALGYRSFAKVDSRSYTSSVSAYSIDVYATGDVATYMKIHPEVSGSNMTIASGTIIVREVLDASGATQELTMMAKGPPGYDPTLGDWWFADTDPSGAVLGTSLGRVAACHGCHIPRATDAFLFGVPAADM